MNVNLHDTFVEEDLPCAEEDLHEVDDRDLEALWLTSGFNGTITYHDSLNTCVLELSEPLRLNTVILKRIVRQATTNDVVQATMICGRRIVLELQAWAEDSHMAAGVWFDRFIHDVSAVDKETRRLLIQADEMEEKILQAISEPAYASSIGSQEF